MTPRPFSGLWQLFFSHPFAGYDLCLWKTFPVYVTSTYFPLSSSMTILNFMSHSRRLQFPDPLKNGAEIIFREFSFRTWLFFKRKLHQGLLSCKPRLKIVVQAPPNKRPPPGKWVISIRSQSCFDSLNLVFKPLTSARRKRCPPSESFQTSSYREEKYSLGFVQTDTDLTGPHTFFTQSMFTRLHLSQHARKPSGGLWITANGSV